MRTFDFMKHFSTFATLAPGSGGSLRLVRTKRTTVTERAKINRPITPQEVAVIRRALQRAPAETFDSHGKHHLTLFTRVSFYWYEFRQKLLLEEFVERVRMLEILFFPVRLQLVQQESFCRSKRIKHHALVFRQIDSVEFFQNPSPASISWRFALKGRCACSGRLLRQTRALRDQ